MAKEGYLINREKYKAIKKYDHSQMSNFCQMVYNSGYKDGQRAGYIDGVCDGEKNVPDIDVGRLSERIGAIKGIGEKKLAEIMEVIEEVSHGRG